MNRLRRAAIRRVMAKLEDLKSEIEEIRDAEQDAYDNLPESFMFGERGEAMESAIDSLEEAADGVDAALEALEAAME